MSKKKDTEPGRPDDVGSADALPPDPDALAAERDDLMARLQRVSADFLNYQKRTARQADEERQFANAELLKDLLPILDDMERALASADPGDPLHAGMQLVHEKALEVLARHGLQPIAAVGAPFDPARHEAMMQQASDGHATPTVLDELQRGYELNGRVLRPARVIVSTPPAGDAPDAAQPDTPPEDQ